MFMRTCVLVGLEPREATIETAVELADASTGLQLQLKIEGASDAAMRESKVRLMAGLSRIGCYVRGSIDVRVPRGASLAELDLALALSVLSDLGRVQVPEGLYCRAELTLAGDLHPVRGTFAALSRMRGVSHAVVSDDNGWEAEATGVRVVRLLNLAEAVSYFRPVERKLFGVLESDASAYQWNEEYQGAAEQVKAAALAGRSLGILGRPGRPKLSLARYYAAHLTLTDEQRLSIMQVWSVAGTLGNAIAVPFRAPHHSVSEAGMIGGGGVPRPGEVSLASGGVLCLDEIGEFRVTVVDTLKRALKLGHVDLAAGESRVRFPAAPRVVVLGGLCPNDCKPNTAAYGDGSSGCKCSQHAKERYHERVTSLCEETIELD